MTSGGKIKFQAATQWDNTYLWLMATDVGLTAKVVLW
jgi:hypothetical protein